MVVADGQGIPLGHHLDSASPAEVKLIEKTLDNISVPRKGRGRPKKKIDRLIYDKAADSDPLRERLKKRGIDLICPHRENRKKKKTQDGRKLRRYKRRWKIERSISWVGNYRRLVVRYDHSIKVYSAFFTIGCMLITLNKLIAYEKDK
jgi:transposase